MDLWQAYKLHKDSLGKQMPIATLSSTITRDKFVGGRAPPDVTVTTFRLLTVPLGFWITVLAPDPTPEDSRGSEIYSKTKQRAVRCQRPNNTIEAKAVQCVMAIGKHYTPSVFHSQLDTREEPIVPLPDLTEPVTPPLPGHQSLMSRSSSQQQLRISPHLNSSRSGFGLTSDPSAIFGSDFGQSTGGLAAKQNRAR